MIVSASIHYCYDQIPALQLAVTEIETEILFPCSYHSIVNEIFKTAVGMDKPLPIISLAY